MYIDKWEIVIEKVNNLSDLFFKNFSLFFILDQLEKFFYSFTIDICSMQ